LLRDGVAPTPVARRRAAVRSTVTRLSSPLPAEADERELLERVVVFHAQTLKESSGALAYLERRGLAHGEMLERFRLGYANRT
jgi:DNA primase